MNSKEKKKKLTLKNFKGSQTFKPTTSKVSTPKRGFEKKGGQFKRNLRTNPLRGGLVKKTPIIQDEKQNKVKEWAKKKIQEELFKGKKKTSTKKTFDNKRKLTIGRALSDPEGEIRQRSYASVKRARDKIFKKVIPGVNQNTKVKREVSIPDLITIQELANRMAERASSVIKYLFEKKIKVTINHTIDADTAEYIVNEFGHKPVRDKIPEDSLKDVLKDDITDHNEPRAPIVTVMGHVDHGKTSLLDALRETDVVSTESGGITQHIGAYQVNVKDKGLITFIDTPGHAAFTEMRARGSKITDIVVLVVAANDGIKPQTVEAIKHSKAAKVPIIVAINKCDLQGIDKAKVKNQLLEHELVVEDMGGDILCVEISALKKQNLDKLKEAILLQSELLDLKTNSNKSAKGIVIESRLDKGKGPVSTILVTSGTLKKGDLFVTGTSNGKIRAMYNYKGDIINEAKPSTPVEVIGLNSVNKAGDDFVVLNNENQIKEIIAYRENQQKNIQNSQSANKDNIFDNQAKEEKINIILKADVHGSLEALISSITKIDINGVSPKIILSAVGPVTETDVNLAKASDAKLIGFNIRPNKEAKELSNKYKITINYFDIIYEALDFIKSATQGLFAPETKEESQGTCEVLEVFKISKIGQIAGVKVKEGEVKNNSDIRLIRDGKVIYTGKIKSLFREKNETKEVKAGLECGIGLRDFNDIKRNDILETFKLVNVDRV
ncbi:MAG: translation initiation factor IF-2 [Candidatus Pelagibacter sp.]|nr:translation initiation factor IF-2 [Candidatus Pelagibacter sp.]|tara:strand:+ start:24428 stop:26596 length:2169 start_codon:yes stop_codon:yes gene_type:complete